MEEYVRILGMVLVLASNSPRRRQILALGGWHFRVQAADVDEQVLPGEDPLQYVLRLAERKAQTIACAASEGTCVIAADTTVAIEREISENQQSSIILAKPQDAEDAIRMLRQLRGRTHQVHTGLAVIKVSKKGTLKASEVVTTEVKMRSYSDEEIRAYVATSDPLDKAGAYAIQHVEFHPVEGLNGCYANVVGLPLCALTRILAKFGIPAASEVARHCLAAAPGDPCAVMPLVIGGMLNR